MDRERKNPQSTGGVLIGWAQTDITPTPPVALGGMSHLRIAREVADPLTATALAIGASDPKTHSLPVIFIGCDLRNVGGEMLAAIRKKFAELVPDIDPMALVPHATHTHNAPPLQTYGMEVDAMEEPQYIAFAAPRIATAAAQAWRNRKPGGISFGLAHAVIGHNRIVACSSGRSVMNGPLNDPEFSHIEGYEDSAVQVLCTWDGKRRMTGLALNVAVTSQISQMEWVVSADFWHETRIEIRRELGENVFILPQCSAAGDQMPSATIYRRALKRMDELLGRSRRQRVAEALTGAVKGILPALRTAVDPQPVFQHHMESVQLPRRRLTEQDVIQAEEEAADKKTAHQAAMEELRKQPELFEDKKWLKATTRLWWLVRRGHTVRERFELQQKEAEHAVELHVVRLGDIAIATNPFELYLDYGMRIKGRAKPLQTFLVQLAAGSEGYLASERSVRGGAYGAAPASTRIGPEGGAQLVEWTVANINRLWPDDDGKPS